MTKSVAGVWILSGTAHLDLGVGGWGRGGGGEGSCPLQLWTLITFLILKETLPNLVTFSKNYLATI